MSLKKNETSGNSEFAIPKENYKFLIVSFVLVILGFLLMVGGKSNDPNVFNLEMFNAQRTILAPLVVVFGFCFGIWAIMRKPKQNEQ